MLRGNLGSIRLSDIFQMLSFSDQPQTLTVSRGGRRKTFYISSGSLTVYYEGAGRAVPLGSILINLRKITEEQLAQALKLQESRGDLVGKLLVEEGIIAPTDLEEVVRVQAEEEIYDLLGWESGEFEVAEGPPPAGATDQSSGPLQLSFDVQGLLMEAMRRVDEWESMKQWVPSLDDVYRWSEDAARENAAPASPAEQRMIDLIDGHRTVAEIIDEVSAPKFDGVVLFARLVEKKLIIPLKVDELRRLARARFAEEDLDGGLALAERVIRLNEGDIDLRLRLARIYERAEQTERAGFHYAESGKRLAETGSRAEAVVALENAVRLNRSDNEARQHLMRIYARLGSQAKAAQVGTDLFLSLVAAKREEDAISAAEEVLDLSPGYTSLRWKLIDVLLKRRDFEAALEHAECIKRFGDQTDEQKVRHLCERILAMDPTNERAARRLSTSSRAAARRLRVTHVATVAAGLLAAAASFLAAGWCVWHLVSNVRTGLS